MRAITQNHITPHGQITQSFDLCPTPAELQELMLEEIEDRNMFEFTMDILTTRQGELNSFIEDIQDRIDFKLAEGEDFDDDLHMKKVNAEEELKDIEAAIDLIEKERSR